ncbi:MAG TPA: DMT family transporter [Bacteroidales bacterium]|nr:DMT family transporter [Bacteroidales bacterium]
MERNGNFSNLGAGVIGLSGVVLFSAKSVFAKMAYEYKVDPISVLYLRMVFSFPLVLLVGFYYERKTKRTAVHWPDILKVVTISVLGYYVSAVFNFIGLSYIQASIERIVLFIYPTMVIFLSAIFLKKPFTIKQLVAISISYFGLVIAFADKLFLHTEAGFWFGVMLILCSALTYAIFLTISDGLITRVGSIRFSTTATLTMCICMIIHALLAGKWEVTGYANNVYLYCILMAVLSTVVPVYMFNYSMSKLGASNVAIISCLGPICTLMLSAALLHESVNIWQIIGTTVVIGGILIIQLGKQAK